MLRRDLRSWLVLLAMAYVRATDVYQENLYGISSGISYYMRITIGQPTYSNAAPKASANNTFKLLIDTGSSNLAVASASCCSGLNSLRLFNCAASSTCKANAKNDAVDVSYVVGSWRGNMVQDTMSSSNVSALPNIPFATISTQNNFFDGTFDGIVGLAFRSIAEPMSNPPPTILESMVQNKIIADVFGLQLCGVLQPHVSGHLPIATAGQLVLGGIQAFNTQLYRGPIHYSPLVVKKWYVVVLTAMGFGNRTLNLPCAVLNTPKAIVDSGTSNLILPTQAYTALLAEIRAATLAAIPSFPLSYFSDSVVCCESYCDPSDLTSPLLDLPSISISLALEGSPGEQITVTIPPTYYWRPLAASNGFATVNCRIFGISEGSGSMLGNVFMDGLYIVHDRAGARMGFAVADNCANKANSSKSITTQGGGSWCECMAPATRSGSLVSGGWPGTKPCFFWAWWTYVIVVGIVVVGVCLVIIAVLCIRKRQHRRSLQHPSFAQLQETLLESGPSPMLSSNTSDDILVMGEARRPQHA